MNPVRRNAFEKEITLARGLMRRNEHDEAFVHLERAHVLGQQNAAPHVLSHWLMLRVAVHRREPAAILGQAARICAWCGWLDRWIRSHRQYGWYEHQHVQASSHRLRALEDHGRPPPHELMTVVEA